ncbi:MAG: hypothetical protein AAGI30_03910 [Planctomycetota bacterium]
MIDSPRPVLATMLGAGLTFSVAHAQAPRIDDGGMIHLEFFDSNTFSPGGTLEAGLDIGQGSTAVAGDAADNPILLNRYPGETYTGDASVLDGRFYSSRLGFLQDGVFSERMPGDSFVVTVTDISDGLEIFEGGMRPMWMVHSFDLIFDEQSDDEGDEWTFFPLGPLNMNHPYVTATEVGMYSATFVIAHTLADGSTGAYGSVAQTVFFEAVPAPGAVIMLAGAVTLRRRRGAGGRS